MGSYSSAAYEQAARRAWAAGKVVPHRITTALDLHALYGPEVDAACGVEEPAVDEWEAGTRYPTWEQLCLLAELCGVTPWMFVMDVPREFPVQTSMRFHRIGGQCDTRLTPPPVRMFTPEAIAEANLPRLTPPPPSSRPPSPRGRRMRRVA